MKTLLSFVFVLWWVSASAQSIPVTCTAGVPVVDPGTWLPPDTDPACENGCTQTRVETTTTPLMCPQSIVTTQTFTRQYVPTPPQPPPPPAVPSFTSMAFPHGLPRFCANPTKQSAKDGPWDSASTWWPVGVPGADDVVSITHQISYARPFSSSLKCVEVFGSLIFSTVVPTQFKTTTLMGYPGSLWRVGTAQSPATAEIIIGDRLIDTTKDPEQYGNGLLWLGKIEMHGEPRTAFIRLDRELKVGDTELSVPGDWIDGDQIVIPDTRQLSTDSGYVPQAEVLTVGTGGLATPTRFAHSGARDQAGNLMFLPHAANLSRSIVVRSENPNGTRGHVMFSLRAEPDIRYVLFKDLGRTTDRALNNTTFDAQGNVTRVGTNQIGRYALHVHHDLGALPVVSQYQFELVGNVVRDARKWGVTIHNSHWGLIQSNVVYNVDGSGYVTEDGSESFNWFDSNIGIKVNGSGGTGIERGTGDLAWEGSGFHFRAMRNRVTNNVFANTLNDYPFKMFMHSLGNVRLPLAQGVDPMMQGVTVRGPSIPILEYDNNEGYGASEGCFTYWWLGTESNSPVANMPESIIKDQKCWAILHTGVLHYPANHVTIDGLQAFNDPKVPKETTAWMGGDYFSKQFEIRNSRIEGFSLGIYPSTRGDLIIRDTRLNNPVDFTFRTLWTSDANALNIPPRLVQFVGVTSSGAKAIQRAYTTQDGRNVIQADALSVDGWQRTGDPMTWRGYWAQQVASYVVPPSRLRSGSTTNFAFVGQPQGTKVGGELAPCATTRPGIDGWVCP